MSIFFIWNPIIVPGKPQSIEFVLTRGDAFSINKGTKKFFQQVFDDLGIEEKVEKWKVKKYRSKYYTDFLGEKDWRDNWQLIWRAQVAANSEIKELPKMEEPWIGTEAADETWETATDEDKETVGCLIVADFAKKADLKKAEKVIEENPEVEKMQKKYSVGKQQFDVTQVMDLYQQLQINLGNFEGDFFASGADYAEQVMELCRKAKGTTHFTERAK